MKKFESLESVCESSVTLSKIFSVVSLCTEPFKAFISLFLIRRSFWKHYPEMEKFSLSSLTSSSLMKSHSPEKQV